MGRCQAWVGGSPKKDSFAALTCVSVTCTSRALQGEGITLPPFCPLPHCSYADQDWGDLGGPGERHGAPFVTRHLAVGASTPPPRGRMGSILYHPLPSGQGHCRLLPAFPN